MSITTTEQRIQEIKQLHNEIVAAVRTTLDKAIRIGELLTDQKAELKHGEWGRWLRENLKIKGFSRATANNYMKLNENRQKLKILNLRNLAGAYRVLYSKTKAKPKPKPKPKPADK